MKLLSVWGTLWFLYISNICNNISNIKYFTISYFPENPEIIVKISKRFNKNQHSLSYPFPLSFFPLKSALNNSFLFIQFIFFDVWVCVLLHYNHIHMYVCGQSAWGEKYIISIWCHRNMCFSLKLTHTDTLINLYTHVRDYTYERLHKNERSVKTKRKTNTAT